MNVLKYKVAFFVFCSVIFSASASFAGNLSSLYSFTEGAADQGMPNITSGDENVAIGDEALNANTSGSNNTAVGDEALSSLIQLVIKTLLLEKMFAF